MNGQGVSTTSGYHHHFIYSQIWQKYNVIYKNNYNLKFNGKGYLIVAELARLCAFHQIINTYNSKK